MARNRPLILRQGERTRISNSILQDRIGSRRALAASLCFMPIGVSARRDHVGFIRNLDGDPNKRGIDRIGSLDWRYSPIADANSQTMPTVSIECLHEIIYGCNQMVHAAHQGNFDPSTYTNSWRMHRRRNIEPYRYWCMVRMNSVRWDELGDRLEILWGPDYSDRYDWQIFEGESVLRYFCKLPAHPPVPEVDKRQELREFDVEAGLRSIGAGPIRPPAIGSTS